MPSKEHTPSPSAEIPSGVCVINVTGGHSYINVFSQAITQLETSYTCVEIQSFDLPLARLYKTENGGYTLNYLANPNEADGFHIKTKDQLILFLRRALGSKIQAE